MTVIGQPALACSVVLRSSAATLAQQLVRVAGSKFCCIYTCYTLQTQGIIESI